MMTEISLNILDVVQNSIRAEASLIEISVLADSKSDTLTILIQDNGTGMSIQEVQKALDPFYTTRTTRKIGLGIPFFKYAAESTGGNFEIRSKPGTGTLVTAVFTLSSIDRMPLGDMTSTMHLLITMNPQIDFSYLFKIDGCSFKLDTREIREIMGNISFTATEVSQYIREYLIENHRETDSKKIL